jgi:hypothetical protein
MSKRDFTPCRFYGVGALIGVIIVALAVTLLHNAVLDAAAAGAIAGALVTEVCGALDILVFRHDYNKVVERLFGELDEANDAAEATLEAYDELLFHQEQRETPVSRHDQIMQYLNIAPDEETIRHVLQQNAAAVMQEGYELRDLAEQRLESLQRKADPAVEFAASFPL